jgi:oligopeptide transport system substrate-binding protein
VIPLKGIFFPILAVCLLCSACGRGTKTRPEQVFHLNLSSGNLESIDPAYAKDLYSMWVVHMTFNTLFETDEQLHLIPSLARRWEVSDDGLQYTIHLRTGVFFHDDPLFPGGKGREMTAGDVVYSFNRLIDPAIASSGAWIFNDRVAERDPFVALDDSTLIINLRAPFRPLPHILSMPYCSIVPREVAERRGRDFRSRPCGTGPFRFHYWDEGNVLVLHRNERYWEQDSAGHRLPYLDAVQISFVDNKASEFLLFMQGKLDFVNGIDGSFKDLLLARDGTLKPVYRAKFRLQVGTYLNTEYIGFLTDTTSPLLQNAAIRDPRVRQAMNYAVDRRKIATYFRNSVAQPALSGFIPAGMPGFDSSGRYGYHYDPERAQQLLAAAGYPRGKGLPEVRILTPDNYLDIVNFVVTQLQDAGIPARAEAIQPNILRQQMSRSQALMFRAQWIADYPDAETYMAFFNSRFPAPPNYTRFHNPTFDVWYDRSMNEPDSLRWQLYQRMDSLAMSYAPVIPLFYDRLLHFTQNEITGFKSTPMNLIDLKQVRREKKVR